MSEAELIFTALAELSTRQVAESEHATGMKENKKAARRGGNVAKIAKEKFEEETGQKVVTDENYLPKPKKQKELKVSDSDKQFSFLFKPEYKTRKFEDFKDLDRKIKMPKDNEYI